MAISPLENSTGVVTFSIESDGKPIPDTVQVVSIVTTHALNRIPVAMLTIIDGDLSDASFPVSDDGHFNPGRGIVIRAGYDQTNAEIFNGVVVKHAIKIDCDNYSRLIIECRDKALAMTVGRKNAHYINQTDGQIISALISKTAGLSATVDSTDISYKELLQYDVTDWDYMMARAEVNSLLVAVDAGKVSVRAPDVSAAPVLALTYGVDLIEFEADLDARSQLASVTASSWDPATLAIVQSTAQPVLLTEQGDISSATLAQVLGAGDFALQTAATLDRAALGAWSKAQQTKAALSRIRGRMVFQGSALAKPGALLELKGVGKHFNGQVMASEVTHRLSDGNWISEVNFGMPDYWYTEQHQMQAPQAAGWTAGISGLHIGIVLKLDADPDGQQRIQVSMPIMNAPTAGVWARLANFYASSGCGALVIPEIGDEVVLGFFNNDPSCPVILGSLYSSQHQAPYDLSADNHIKAFVTRSQLKMEFDDSKKIITLTTPARNKIVISDDAQSICLQDQNGNTVELSPSGILFDSAGDMTIRAKGSVNISAAQDIAIAAAMNVASTAMNIHHSANASFVANGNASAEISASGVTTVKGAMVMIN